MYGIILSTHIPHRLAPVGSFHSVERCVCERVEDSYVYVYEVGEGEVVEREIPSVSQVQPVQGRQCLWF